MGAAEAGPDLASRAGVCYPVLFGGRLEMSSQIQLAHDAVSPALMIKQLDK